MSWCINYVYLYVLYALPVYSLLFLMLLHVNLMIEEAYKQN